LFSLIEVFLSAQQRLLRIMARRQNPEKSSELLVPRPVFLRRENLDSERKQPSADASKADWCSKLQSPAK
jgi:hypothetical protein